MPVMLYTLTGCGVPVIQSMTMGFCYWVLSQIGKLKDVADRCVETYIKINPFFIISVQLRSVLYMGH